MRLFLNVGEQLASIILTPPAVNYHSYNAQFLRPVSFSFNSYYVIVSALPHTMLKKKIHFSIIRDEKMRAQDNYLQGFKNFFFSRVLYHHMIKKKGRGMG